MAGTAAKRTGRKFWMDKVGKVISATVWDRTLNDGFIPNPRWAAKLNPNGTMTCPMCQSRMNPELKTKCPNKKCKAQVCGLIREHLSEERL